MRPAPLSRRATLGLGGLLLTELCGCRTAAQSDAHRDQPLDALSPTGSAPAVLHVGITPTTGSETHALIRPMAEYLTGRLKRRVEAKTAASYDDLAPMLEREEVHVAIFSPAAFVKARAARLAGVPIATVTRNGSPTYLGYLVARGAPPAPTLDTFRGRRVAWVERSSTSGYLYPRELMRARGLDPTTFFGSEMFLRDHESSIRAVIAGQADIAATASPFLDPDSDKSVPGSEALVVVAKTQRIPLDCVVVHEGLERDLAKSLQRALFSLTNDAVASRELAKSWGLGGFVRPVTERYDEIARVLALGG